MEKKGLIGLVILAIFAATIGSTASATASASGDAAAAKKKCKKAHRAKRKCKKRKKRADLPTTPTPVLRATLTWSNFGTSGVDVDLHVFDSNGNQAGNGSNAIPLSSLSSDVSGAAGSETFTDDLFTPQAARDLSFGVCYLADFPGAMNFTITYVTADGVIHGDSQTFVTSGHFDYPGGAPISTNYCGFT
jgi:uncharacterized protein YfaP (DUF2135 family)